MCPIVRIGHFQFNCFQQTQNKMEMKFLCFILILDEKRETRKCYVERYEREKGLCRCHCWSTLKTIANWIWKPQNDFVFFFFFVFCSFLGAPGAIVFGVTMWRDNHILLKQKPKKLYKFWNVLVLFSFPFGFTSNDSHKLYSKTCNRFNKHKLKPSKVKRKRETERKREIFRNHWFTYLLFSMFFYFLLFYDFASAIAYWKDII